jgi:glyoxylase-like metal-dependent hydrolase (beta-lactamase superfamily II)
MSDIKSGTEPGEIAPGVYWLSVGRGPLQVNVYFVRSGPTWTLVDAGTAEQAAPIRDAAERLFGADNPPASILLTHDHPDHAGSARELAESWGCPVLVHPDEMPLALGNVAAFRHYAGPLDHKLILPAMRLIGSRRRERMVEASSLRGVVGPLDVAAGPPGLPAWEVIHTPGHTPGHVALFRRADRVLISGDALLTKDVNSLRGLLSGRQQISGPPWMATWSERVAKRSVGLLSELQPRIVGAGHGIPAAAPDTAARMREFADSLAAD